jgi:hypothetical protein
MGRQTTAQTRLFYESRLKDRIPEGHLQRGINCFVRPALADLYNERAAFNSHSGQLSIDPERMKLAGPMILVEILGGELR